MHVSKWESNGSFILMLLTKQLIQHTFKMLTCFIPIPIPYVYSLSDLTYILVELDLCVYI